jgi:hypothetical protein
MDWSLLVAFSATSAQLETCVAIVVFIAQSIKGLISNTSFNSHSDLCTTGPLRCYCRFHCSIFEGGDSKYFLQIISTNSCLDWSPLVALSATSAQLETCVAIVVFIAQSMKEVFPNTSFTFSPRSLDTCVAIVVFSAQSMKDVIPNTSFKFNQKSFLLLNLWRVSFQILPFNSNSDLCTTGNLRCYCRFQYIKGVIQILPNTLGWTGPL